MIGSIVNAATVIVGGVIGLGLQQKMSSRVTTIYFQAMGLFTMAIGINMVWQMEHVLIVVTSVALGGITGEWLNIEKTVGRLSNWAKTTLNIGNERFSEGLVTSFLLFCVGSMTVVGAIEEGITGTSDLLMTKSLMDGFSAILLASAFGIGVLFSSIPLLLFQGGITLLAAYFGEFLSPEIVKAISAVGGILLLGLSINILEIKKLKIMNLLPSLVFVIILMWLSAKFNLPRV